jgi:hypothetical protein
MAAIVLLYCGQLLSTSPAIYHSGVIRLVNLLNRLLFAAALASTATVVSSAQAPAAPASSQQPAPATPTQQTGTINGVYIASDPLAGVRYDNRWDISVGLAFGHIHAGPNLREGADLGGIDLSGSYWLTKHLGVEANGRGYLGTSGTAPNDEHLDGLFVSQYMFLAGPEYLGPHNKHAAVIVHALLGGAYGDFNTDLRGATPGPTGPAAFYNNQLALGGAFGGHIDLNRSPHWVFRVTPDALLTGYDGTSQYPHYQWNFGISAGVQYKFKGKR